MSAKRYPLEPLMALTRHPEGRRLSHGEVGKRAGLGASTVQKYSKNGVSVLQAERLAVALGFDPYVVWPEMLDDTLAELEKPCDECGTPYMPSRRTARFCSPQCRWRHNQRVNYKYSRKRERNARYYDECREYLQRQAAQYRVLNAERLSEKRHERYERDGEKERARVAAYYLENREKRKEYMRQYRARKKAERLLQGAESQGNPAPLVPALSLGDETVSA